MLKFIFVLLVSQVGIGYISPPSFASDKIEQLIDKLKKENNAHDTEKARRLEKVRDICVKKIVHAKNNVCKINKNTAVSLLLTPTPTSYIRGYLLDIMKFLRKGITGVNDYFSSSSNFSISEKNWQKQKGKIMLNTLQAYLQAEQSKNELTLCQTACLSTCVTKMMIKFIHSPKSLFAPASTILDSGNAACIDYSTLNYELATSMNVPSKIIAFAPDDFISLVSIVAWFSTASLSSASGIFSLLPFSLQTIVQVGTDLLFTGSVTSIYKLLSTLATHHYMSFKLDDENWYYLDPLWIGGLDKESNTCEFYTLDSSSAISTLKNIFSSTSNATVAKNIQELASPLLGLSVQRKKEAIKKEFKDHYLDMTREYLLEKNTNQRRERIITILNEDQKRNEIPYLLVPSFYDSYIYLYSYFPSNDGGQINQHFSSEITPSESINNVVLYPISNKKYYLREETFVINSMFSVYDIKGKISLESSSESSSNNSFFKTGKLQPPDSSRE